MKLKWLYQAIKADLKLYKENYSFFTFLKFLIYKKGFKVIFWMRISQYFYFKFKPLALVPIMIHYMYRIRYGIDFPFQTKIGKGMAIHHGMGLVVHPKTIFGDNVTLSHGVTLGNKSIFEKESVPVIGNNVYVAAGAKIIGNVHIGDNVIIGANCVVTKDVPSDHVAVGIPNKNYKNTKNE